MSRLFVTTVALCVSAAAFAASNLYHANGQLAWNGTSTGNVYHATGQLAWNHTSTGNVYHHNGQLAWNHTSTGNVYHANGQLAWNHTSTGDCYHATGQRMQTSCQGVTVSLGDGVLLSVGMGDTASLSVLGTVFSPL
jgi:hypothetical protein